MAAPILALRKAIIAHLRADGAVTGTSIGSRIYGERAPAQPTWPFARYGISDATPGFSIAAPVHVFSKDPFTDDVNAVAEAIATSLDGAVLTLEDGRKAHVQWNSTRTVPSDADEWHAIVDFGAVVPLGC